MPRHIQLPLFAALLCTGTLALCAEPYQSTGEVNVDKRIAKYAIPIASITDATTRHHNPVEESQVTEVLPEEEESTQEKILSVLDEPHKHVSQTIEALITGIDKFFANEELYTYTTNSYVLLSGEVLHEEREGETSVSASLRARIDLPRTKRKLKVLIDTDPPERQNPVERSVDRAQAATSHDNDVYASIQREGKSDGWRMRPSVGIKIRAPLEPFAKLQLTKLYPLENWQARLDENLYWFKDTSFGSDTTVNFDLPVGDDNLFRATSFARWTKDTDYFDLSQTFTFYQTLSSKRKVSYQIGAYGQTQPSWRVTQYLATIRYRQNIRKDWMFLEVQPQALFQKSNDWDDELSVSVKLEIFFGDKYL